MPKKFLPFFMVILMVALPSLAYSLWHVHWNLQMAGNLLVFAVLAVLSESLPVPLPKGGFVTVSNAILFASIVLFPPGVVLSVATLGGLLVFGREVKGEPLFKRVFNASQFVLSGAAGHVAVMFMGTGLANFHLSVGSAGVYLMSALLYMSVNISIVAFALGLLQDKSPWAILASNIRWAIPNFMALAPLGFLMALVYQNYGGVGLILLIIPLLLSRHAFQLYMDMRQNYLDTVEALVQALEAKDAYTSGHSGRVAQLSVRIAEVLDLPEEKTEFIRYAGVLHDVGKIGVSEEILNKPGRLSEEEWVEVRNHPAVGESIVKKITFLFDVGPVIRHHHERYDGLGYPDGLAGEAIPLESRIIAVADAYDAITSDRSYRKGKSRDEAVIELRHVAGTQLDPGLVTILLKVIAEEERRTRVGDFELGKVQET